MLHQRPGAEPPKRLWGGGAMVLGDPVHTAAVIPVMRGGMLDNGMSRCSVLFVGGGEVERGQWRGVGQRKAGQGSVGRGALEESGGRVVDGGRERGR